MSEDSLRYVTAKLCGGFGNQLFQVAAMLGYAERSGGRHVPVFLEEFVGDDVKSWEHPSSSLRVRDFFPSIPVIARNAVDHWMVVKEKPENCYTFVALPVLEDHHVFLDGYFQSERYFPTDLEKAGFPTSPPLPPFAPEALPAPFATFATLAATDWSRTFFLHVRRGDYLSPANRHHCVDLSSYYREALGEFEAGVAAAGEDPATWTCFVVSDDIAWCREAFAGDLGSAWRGKWLFCPAELTDAETLYWTTMVGLGGICANSTFSWWAAFFVRQQRGAADEQIRLFMPRPWGHPPLPPRRDLYPAWATVLGEEF